MHRYQQIAKHPTYQQNTQPTNKMPTNTQAVMSGLTNKVKELTTTNKQLNKTIKMKDQQLSGLKIGLNARDQEIINLKKQLADQQMPQQTPQHIDWDWGALPDAPLVCKPTKAPRKSPVRKVIAEDSLCQCRRYVKVAQTEKVRIGGQILERNAQCTYAHRHTIGGYNVCNHHKRQIDEDKLAFGYIGDDLDTVVKRTPKNVHKYWFDVDKDGVAIDELELSRNLKNSKPKKSPVLKSEDYDLATLEALLSAKKLALGVE